ncbi:MFS transporter [Herbaspirillum sp. WKF16]|uniref:MFS transporter n=1 Tax=Herbaspirillum sp. WKF16 TaxID=3028312 RepID=UPI0023A93BA5|nr:MFS transporter [Herbaspirillum sp. WKF16]WDZ96969.1 MFS transporter [Herbaspirillum sp. WKF16]
MAINALAAIQLVSWGTSYYIFGLILVPVETDLGLNRGPTALAFPVALLLEGLCSIIVGRWIARNLGMYVMVGGSLLAGAGLWMLSQANSLLQFQTAWALIGTSFSCTLYTPLFSLVTMVFPTSYRRKITVISLITGFSSTLFLPLSGWLIAEMGWRNCLLFYAMLNVLICAPGHWLALRAIYGGAESPIQMESVSQAANIPLIAVAYRRRRIYLSLAVFTSAIGALSATVAAHLVPMLTERGISSETALWAPAAIGALQTLSRVPILMIDMGKKVHQINLILILIFPVAVLLLHISGVSASLLIIFVFLYGIAHGGWTIVRATAVPQYLGPWGAAAINGYIAFWSTIGRITLPLLVAVLWSVDQGYFYGYWLLQAVAILGFLAYASAQRTYFKS